MSNQIVRVVMDNNKFTSNPNRSINIHSIPFRVIGKSPRFCLIFRLLSGVDSIFIYLRPTYTQRELTNHFKISKSEVKKILKLMITLFSN